VKYLKNSGGFCRRLPFFDSLCSFEQEGAEVSPISMQSERD